MATLPKWRCRSTQAFTIFSLYTSNHSSLIFGSGSRQSWCWHAIPRRILSTIFLFLDCSSSFHSKRMAGSGVPPLYWHARDKAKFSTLRNNFRQHSLLPHNDRSGWRTGVLPDRVNWAESVPACITIRLHWNCCRYITEYGWITKMAVSRLFAST